MLILPAFPVRQRTVLHRWLRFPFFYQPVLQKGIRCAILNRNRPAAESRLSGTEVRMKNSGEEYRLHELLPLGVTAPRVYAAVDRAALAHNYRLLVRRAESVAGHPTIPISVVKADAYGHGVKPCAETLAGAGCRAYAVACVEEAIALRSVLEEADAGDAGFPGMSPADSLILILGYTDPACVPLLARYRLTAALVSAEHARRMSEAARAVGVRVQAHIALDTGMNRIGLAAHSAAEIGNAVQEAAQILTLPGLAVGGMFSHFAEADGDCAVEMADGSRTMTQYARFAAVRDGLAARGLRPALCHICNSAATVRFPSAHPECLPDAIRMGINLYGYGVPFPGEQGDPEDGLRPVMKLCTSVVHVHSLLSGERVGYGGTYTASSPRRLVTLPVGYADGWIRAFSGASVTIHTVAGTRTAPIVGRICMDQCMADVTGLPVQIGDPVTLFGQSAGQLEELAERAGTIPYELLCLITARVPRIPV